MRSIARQVCEQLVGGKFGSVCGSKQSLMIQRVLPLTVLFLSLLCCCSTNDSRQHVTEPDPQRPVPQQQPGPTRASRGRWQSGTPRRARRRRKERFPWKSRITRPARRERYDCNSERERTLDYVKKSSYCGPQSSMSACINTNLGCRLLLGFYHY